MVILKGGIGRVAWFSVENVSQPGLLTPAAVLVKIRVCKVLPMIMRLRL